MDRQMNYCEQPKMRKLLLLLAILIGLIIALMSIGCISTVYDTGENREIASYPNENAYVIRNALTCEVSDEDFIKTVEAEVKIKSEVWDIYRVRYITAHCMVGAKTFISTAVLYYNVKQ